MFDDDYSDEFMAELGLIHKEEIGKTGRLPPSGEMSKSFATELGLIPSDGVTTKPVVVKPLPFQPK